MNQVNIVRALQQFFANMHGMCQQLVTAIGDNDVDDKDESMSVASSSKSQRSQRVKKPRDPLAPKKPVSAFLYYFKMNREDVKQNNADLKSHDITRQVAKNWNELSKEDRSEYEQLAADDRRRYEQELKLYVTKDASDEEKPLKKKVKQ